MEIGYIRNFSIIAHIDHGKSTLADRLLEETNTVEARKMKEQVLDQMELERERGITIKMQPVRMKYVHEGKEYVLNLIDTPGHIDFSYEVSRALVACEGVILLVDATQGVQAQTLTTLEEAQLLDLAIIPVLNKVDLPNADTDSASKELVNLLGCDADEIIEVSAKTGENVSSVLEAVVKRIPPPTESKVNELRALIFDIEYSNHRGVIVYVRVFDGSIAKNDSLKFIAGKESFKALEIGVFTPEKVPIGEISAGESGYIVTGLKKPGKAHVGDTIAAKGSHVEAISGYHSPQPVVFASVYPESQDDFLLLSQSLDRLSLSDSALSYEQESSGALGRGFRLGFLGMLHLEIVTERLKREFNLELIVTQPSIQYKVTFEDGSEKNVYSPHQFPDEGTYRSASEQWVKAQILSPSNYIGAITQLLYDHEARVEKQEGISGDRQRLHVRMPLRELMRGFFDELKSATSGYASLSYTLSDFQDTNVIRLDIIIGGEVVPAFSKVISPFRIEKEARSSVEKLRDILPRQMFVIKIQAQAKGRIIASKTLSAFKKDVTAKLYGGDITRKMKLREKQKKGKKKMREQGKINIPHDVFLKMMKNS